MMIRRYSCCGIWTIWLSFLIAMILQIIPWPYQLYFFRPSWINLMFIYWTVTLPYQVNFITGLILGLITDLILCSILGVRALAFSIISYLVVFQFQLFRNIDLWQQMLIVMLLSLTAKVIIFLIEYLVSNISFHWEIFWSSLVDAILWPWIFLLMNKIRRQFYI